MQQRNISVSTILACVHSGDKTVGYSDALRHHLLGYTAVTQQTKKGLLVLTVYEGSVYKKVHRH